MKTVSGKVVSTEPISLSRAAKLISVFTASDNEASPAFSAYLKRTSAAFNELVYLHKDNSIPLGESRINKDRSTSSAFITLGTPTSSKVTHVGLSTDEEANVNSKKNKDRPSGERHVINEIGNRHGSVSHVGGDAGKKSKKKRGSDVNCYGDQDNIKMGNPNAIEELKNYLPDVGDVGKKSRKKRGTDDHVPVIDNDPSHDAINENGELKKRKKKIDKLEQGDPDVASETVQEVQHRPHRPDDGVGEAVDTVQNIRDEQKKHKKSKVKETEQKGDGNVMKEGKKEKERKVESKSDVSDGKKHKKKRSHEPEIRENGCSVETEAADKKANRKRKHERVADGELEGSHEAVRAKKKKYNHRSR
ncbi:hypothetical protein KSS87_010145 [Heliosperma pusillum]|nr:hypothetical protein KSS87_010145 [Heliosperma pusillum]